MPIKKSELYSSIWKSCDQFRGVMDPSQYKAYVLVLLFVKYVPLDHLALCFRTTAGLFPRMSDPSSKPDCRSTRFAPVNG